MVREEDLVNVSLRKEISVVVLLITANYIIIVFDLCVFRFSDLTGVDYSEDAINLAQSLAERDGFSNIKFLVWYLLIRLLSQQH